MSNNKKKTPGKIFFKLLFIFVLLFSLLIFFNPSFMGQGENVNDELPGTETKLVKKIGLYINGRYVGYTDRHYEFDKKSYEYYVEFEISPNDRVEYYHGKSDIQHFWLEGFKKESRQNLKIVDIHGAEYLTFGNKGRHRAASFNGLTVFKTDKYLKAAVGITNIKK